MTFKIPDPELQVSFARALAEIRSAMLQDALRDTVRALDIPAVDKELADIVPAHSLATLAGCGLRGELMFAAPIVIAANPRLVGYYRLLYGYSQKEFYKPGIGSMFRSAETTGKLSRSGVEALPVFCGAMAEAGALLLAGVSTGVVNAAVLDDLTLLTLGPQLRGGANVAIGSAAIAAVFGAIKGIVSGAIESSDRSRIELKNAAGRTVLIEFAPDPDIIIREQFPSGSYRHVIAIEVKGGRDFSNIHNRIGEAEKSHQKARANGYTECWTVVNVDNIDLTVAKRESPSSDRFYRMTDLITARGDDFDDFRDRVVALTGIRTN
jgi:hypothetical protein